MAWAFRRRIKVIPGVSINLSKSGISASAGVRGASLTFRSDGIYRNLGLPGTGLYSRQKVGNYGGGTPADEPDQGFLPDEGFDETAPDYSFISADPLEVTSEGLQGLQQAVIDANRQRDELKRDAASIRDSLSLIRFGAILSKLCLVYFLLPSLKRAIQAGIKARQDALREVSSSIELSVVSLAVEMDAECRASYLQCQHSFDALTRCASIWDVTSGSDVDRVRSRSAAAMSIERSTTKCLRQGVPGISSPELPLVFLNRNGADIYVYPGFFVMYESPSRMGILDMAELEVSYESTRFIETEAVPPDSSRVGEVWEKSNKDGSRDKRYAENRQLPVMEYGEITFRSRSGIYEKYMFSDARQAGSFFDALQGFKSLL
ncbi:DUF4236 domain-containing protein [Synechococcus sp. A10-1-5-1]|uniref:DUF4236 domain-containing protein n=1 Tax=Synechococcus sp. A10-1-5-1 TaxID=2936507 RepID=UPI002000DCF8|nr:DUF4236 domain-containing protein [Synechococcus sp. A10-1-5-1]UPM50129.1 DUF4236 domain-containing protein [Synechococcus sp. A10-1-5-1]